MTELDSSDIAVGADAFLERRAQVLDGIEFVPEHVDRFASDDVLEVWKDIAAIEAGPVGNGRGRRVTAILRSSHYLDRELVMSVPTRVKLPTIRVMVTPALPISRVTPVICQCVVDRSADRHDPEGIAYQRAVARREGRTWGLENPRVRVNHVSINARDELELGWHEEIVLAGDIWYGGTNDR